MLKMYIDNEEVVSKNDFTIKEEMLSASSTILNNTYPKSWETDHDYISRFYYPKDYSKLILNKETYFPHLDGETIEGSSFQIQADTSLKDEYYFKGNTTQNGTPTPSTPIPINVATGLQDVNVVGKNLFSGFTKGITLSSVNGVEMSSSTSAATDFIPVDFIENSSYYINDLTNRLFTFVAAYNKDKAFLGRTGAGGYSYTGIKSNLFTGGTPQGTGDICYIRITTYQNVNVPGTIDEIDNLQVMLNEGNSALPYEPYIGNKYGINLGKNLFDMNWLSGTGITLTDGVASGTAFDLYTNFNKNGAYIPNTNNYTNPITVSVSAYTDGNDTTSGTGIYVRVYYTDNTYTGITFMNNETTKTTKTFTTVSTKTIAKMVITYSSGSNNIWHLSEIQVEKGSTATSFSPYFTPIELNKIGTYQDRIFKNTLTSPYYDSNLELDKWYLYKEIGKVVLTGASDEIWATAGTNTYYRYRYLENFVYEGYIPQPLLCNQFKSAQIGTTTTDLGFFVTSTGELRFREETMKTIANWKTFISNNPLVIYYVLATPTCTEITNTTLINELESIRLLNGLNNIAITSANLPMIMNLHYNYQTEHTDVDTIFSGMVKNTNNISLNPREPKYCGLEILDYKTLLSEGKTLDYVISNKTILEAITMVVDSISEYGFELGNVNILNGDEIIGAYSTENKTAYDVLQYLADISGAKWNCRRKDDTNMYIDFYDPTLMPRGTQIEYTTEWSCNNNLVDLKFNYGTRDYRNKQIILSDEVEGNIEYNDRLSSDGVNKEYTLPYKIATLNKVEIDGIEQSIATKEEKDVGIYADFYYSRDTDSFTSNKVLPYGTLLDISYTPIIKGREVVQNDTEINRITNQLEVDGTISRYETRNDTTDSDKLINIGETYLKYKGEAEITLTIKTFNNNLYNVGQVVYFNAPIPELQRDYLVKSKQIQVISSDENELNIFYTFTLSSSFNAEKEINWFDNQRAKLEGNIGEGEFISRNIDINNNANVIWDNLRVEEVSLPSGASNDLQASLEAPLIH